MQKPHRHCHQVILVFKPISTTQVKRCIATPFSELLDKKKNLLLEMLGSRSNAADRDMAEKR